MVFFPCYELNCAPLSPNAYVEVLAPNVAILELGNSRSYLRWNEVIGMEPKTDKTNVKGRDLLSLYMHYMHTEKRPCGDTERRQPSMNQEEILTLMAP